MWTDSRYAIAVYSWTSEIRLARAERGPAHEDNGGTRSPLEKIESTRQSGIYSQITEKRQLSIYPSHQSNSPQLFSKVFEEYLPRLTLFETSTQILHTVENSASMMVDELERKQGEVNMLEFVSNDYVFSMPRRSLTTSLHIWRNSTNHWQSSDSSKSSHLMSYARWHWAHTTLECFTIHIWMHAAISSIGGCSAEKIGIRIEDSENRYFSPLRHPITVIPTLFPFIVDKFIAGLQLLGKVFGA